MKQAHNRSAWRLYCFLVLTLSVSVLLPSCRSAQRQPAYYWLMNGPAPDSSVRVWISEMGDHEGHCDEEKLSKAAALLTVYVALQDVNNHKIHYHLRNEDRGLVLTEYLSDEKSDTGERRLGRDEPVHYHGMYVDLDPAKELAVAVKSHQHGAE